MKYPELDDLETFEDNFHLDTRDFDEGANDTWDDTELDEEDEDE